MNNRNSKGMMKYIKTFFCLIFTLIFYSSSIAQNFGTITNFEILPQYLDQSGRVKVVLGEKVVPIKFKVSVSRQLESSYPTMIWKNVDITLGLSSVGSNSNTPVFVSGTKKITNADFPDNYSAFVHDLIITVNFDTRLLTDNKPIILGYKVPYQTPMYSYNGSSYEFSRLTGGIPPSLQGYAKEFGLLSTIPMTFIYPNDTTPALTVGNSIYSPNQQYRLTLQTDGNLVLYKRINTTAEQALWASDKNTSLKPKSLFFQTDGNLVLYLGYSLGTGFAWAADVSATSLNLLNSQNAAYALQDDGNLVFYWLYPEINGMYKWVFGSTGTAGGVVSPNFGRIVGAPHL